MYRYKAWAALVIASLAGCAGNGNGLDQNGQLITDGGGAPGGPVTADLKSIEENVFTPICSKCHIGASGPEGLQLDAAHAYNLLVGVPSVEEPSLLRVNPGNPDASYMVQKIEGAPGIEGGQMPLGETPLPQATIDAIRQWITDGAPNVPGAAAAAAARPFAIDTTDPLDRSIVSAPMKRIVVAFTHEVDASLVNDTTITLERIAGSGGAQTIPVGRKLVAENPSVLLLTPAAALEAGLYRVTLRGTGGAALADLNAQTLGSDASLVFSVESPP
jgi:hypothetical protein